mgnify:CR=1 FL=1
MVDGVYRIPEFKPENYQKIDKALERQKDKRKEQEENSKKKKKDQKVGNALENLADNLGRYTDQENQFFSG